MIGMSISYTMLSHTRNIKEPRADKMYVTFTDKILTSSLSDTSTYYSKFSKLTPTHHLKKALKTSLIPPTRPFSEM